MICEDCKEEVLESVCRNCGLVIEDRPLVNNAFAVGRKNFDITTLHSVDSRIYDHPLSPNIRKKSWCFNPRYQKDQDEYRYVKAYEQISKVCGILRMPDSVRYESLNIFKGLKKKDGSFFQVHGLAPTYLACIKIACRIHDFPISNHDLSQLIDYDIKIKKNSNVGYMEKKFNRAFRHIIKIYKMHFSRPKKPNYINYVGIKLNYDIDFIKFIYNEYSKLSKFFQHHFRLEGYILALFYVYGKPKFGLTIKKLEETFHMSALTITNRKNEILKMVINNKKSL